MIINKSGITIRLKVADVRIMGRATQGVRLINLENVTTRSVLYVKLHPKAWKMKFRKKKEKEIFQAIRKRIHW